MPIEIKALPKAEYAAWLEKAKQEFAMSAPVSANETITLAAAN